MKRQLIALTIASTVSLQTGIIAMAPKANADGGFALCTTIILVLVLISNAQNRDAKAIVIETAPDALDYLRQIQLGDTPKMSPQLEGVIKDLRSQDTKLNSISDQDIAHALVEAWIKNKTL